MSGIPPSCGSAGRYAICACVVAGLDRRGDRDRHAKASRRLSSTSTCAGCRTTPASLRTCTICEHPLRPAFLNQGQLLELVESILCRRGLRRNRAGSWSTANCRRRPRRRRRAGDGTHQPCSRHRRRGSSWVGDGRRPEAGTGSAVLEAKFADFHSLQPEGTATLAGGRNVPYTGVGYPEDLYISGPEGTVMAEADLATVYLHLADAALIGRPDAVNDVVLTVVPGADRDRVEWTCARSRARRHRPHRHRHGRCRWRASALRRHRQRPAVLHCRCRTGPDRQGTSGVQPGEQDRRGSAPRDRHRMALGAPPTAQHPTGPGRSADRCARRDFRDPCGSAGRPLRRLGQVDARFPNTGHRSSSVRSPRPQRSAWRSRSSPACLVWRAVHRADRGDPHGHLTARPGRFTDLPRTAWLPGSSLALVPLRNLLRTSTNRAHRRRRRCRHRPRW